MVFLYIEDMNNELFDAIREGVIDTVSKILNAHPELVNIKDARGSTPLLLATYYGHQEIAEIILKCKPDINAKDGSGNTALMGVCFKGYPAIAKLLISHGADVNAVNFNNATALIYAATFAQADIARLLLEHGADASYKDDRGHKAYDHAKMQGVKPLMDLLENS